MKDPILEVNNLRVSFRTYNGKVQAVRGIDFKLFEGETLAIVGESGSGKSVTTKAILGILPKNSIIEEGEILYKGDDLTKYKEKDFYKIRGKEISLIFQDPLSALNPIMKIGKQITEALVLREHMTKEQAKKRAIELMEMVGIPRPEERFEQYPFQFSGGMRQRIGIARALAVEPRLLLCDEPISALDVSIQAQIVNLLLDLREQKSLTYLLISHDLSMVRHLSDRILVMYLGEVVEESTAQELYTHPLHPYTKALIAAIPIPDPKVERARPRSVLQGQVPSPVDPPPGCRFAGRCPYATDRCRTEKPELCDMGGGHRVACHLCR